MSAMPHVPSSSLQVKIIEIITVEINFSHIYEKLELHTSVKSALVFFFDSTSRA